MISVRISPDYFYLDGVCEAHGCSIVVTPEDSTDFESLELGKVADIIELRDALNLFIEKYLKQCDGERCRKKKFGGQTYLEDANGRLYKLVENGDKCK